MDEDDQRWGFRIEELYSESEIKEIRLEMIKEITMVAGDKRVGIRG